MKKVLFMSIAIVGLLAGFVHARDHGTVLIGRYDDLHLLAPQVPQPEEFSFVRLIYNGQISGYYKNWYTDYPKGDRQLIEILRRLTNLDIAPSERAIPIRHPDLVRYPFVYSAEAGQMRLDSSGARVLREYLDRGGFWMVDDFWGSAEWQSFEETLEKIFPDQPIVELPPSHPIFHNVFDIDKIMQVPSIAFANCSGNCSTSEQDGHVPHVRAILDEDDIIRVLINFNTDLMDASEWADDPRYPERFSAYSYRLFTNAVVYAMSH